MKKLLLASMIAAAAMFTACGGDDDSSPTSGGNGADEKKSSSISDNPSSSTSGGSGKFASCDVKVSMNGAQMGHTCLESTSSEAAKKECEGITINGQEVEEQGAKVIYSEKFGSGCASGSKKTCTASKNGVDVSIFVYDAVTSSMECSNIIGGYAR